ncbi:MULTISPECIES: tetratricopeptide repeat protein [unclassified Gordonia (in: high G+C Gram-positive bacteria)]|uniref:tetratricopeptide repeat protein n=1 Tax=Gordonia TaxID=2053 RepID=UPI0010FA077F|nr:MULTISPECIES: tetratricopeptide repeat protein [unclassified Gordonia (in: high G+C Gram-positive bacteria)]MBR7194285.1 tetratricopeptide repeat protein [Gordonia sp. SCSIO 19800]MDT0221925.1 tetratricopeptide repeat protein [Gordonia sp. AC31]
MVEVDYYELLGVTRTASEAEIEQASKRATRQWTKRASSPNIDVRHEAETKMKRLRESREVLLGGADKRAAYDRALAQGVAPASAPSRQPVGAGGQVDWVATAREALANNDYHSAAYAAKEATTVLAGNAESWSLRSRANLGLGRVQDALFEARHATEIEMNNAEYHFNLGNVHEQLRDWVAALKEYQVATQLDSQNFVYPLAQGSVLQQNGLLDEAIDMYRRVFAQHQTVDPVRYYLGIALLEKAETVPKLKGNGRYAVTAEEEIAPMVALASEAQQLSRDPEIQQEAARILEYLHKQNEMTWCLPTTVSDAPFMWLGGVVGAFLLGVVLMGVSSGIGVLLILASLAAVGLIVWQSYVPGWKKSKRKNSLALMIGHLQ